MNNPFNFPSDTPMSIRKKQIEIVQSKSNGEKLQLTAEIVDFSYYQEINLLLEDIYSGKSNRE